jgi:prephenate dehydratase
MSAAPEPDKPALQGRCAFQGALGAFSHEACLDLRPWDEPAPFATFEAALAAVQKGEAGCALIPVENSTIGRVEPAATLVERSNLRVICEVWRPIRLALMAPLGARLGGIRTAESHPAALGQCAVSLQDLGITPVEAFDTAGAAQAVAEARDRSRAAVGPARAAEVYGLTILRQDVQDASDNRTRFLLVSRDET